MALLGVKDLSVWYGAFRALDGVSFDLDEGKTLAVVGANGAGKSSLARGLCGLIAPARGSVRFDGTELAGMPAHKIRRQGLCYLPEGRGISRTMSVLDNLRIAVQALNKSERQGGIDRAFEQFPILADRRAQLAGTLSGGEQQMLSLARSLIGNPKLLIADEVSLGLAPLIVEAVYEQLEAARKQGLTLIIIEQFIHRALNFSDRVVVLVRGSLAIDSPTSDITPEEILSSYIGETTAV